MKYAACLNETVKRNRENKRLRLIEAKSKGTHDKEEWIYMKNKINACVKCESPSYEVVLCKDHIKPLYQGGSDSIQNIQPLCVHCNSGKGRESKDYRLRYCKKNKIRTLKKWGCK